MALLVCVVAVALIGAGIWRLTDYRDGKGHRK